MRRTLLSLSEKGRSWRDQVGKRSDIRDDLKEGLKAYALEQALLHERLALHFRSLWKMPLDSGEMLNDADESDDDEDDCDEVDNCHNKNARANPSNDDNGDDNGQQGGGDDATAFEDDLV
jgi:hypothetical protein